MLVQAILFTWIYMRLFSNSAASVGSLMLQYALLGALLSWSSTTLAVSAKNIMASVPRYMLIETAFTAVQWILVSPLTVLTIRGGSRQ